MEWPGGVARASPLLSLSKKMVLGKVVSKDAVLAKNRSTPQGAPVDVVLYASAAVMMAVEQSPTK